MSYKSSVHMNSLSTANVIPESCEQNIVRLCDLFVKYQIVFSLALDCPKSRFLTATKTCTFHSIYIEGLCAP